MTACKICNVQDGWFSGNCLVKCYITKIVLRSNLENLRV